MDGRIKDNPSAKNNAELAESATRMLLTLLPVFFSQVTQEVTGSEHTIDRVQADPAPKTFFMNPIEP